MASPVSPTRPASPFGWLLDAIRGTHRDFTTGSIGRAVLLLATPMVLEMAMESLFGIVDVFWVTRLGENAIATVGLTESMLSLIFAVALGLSLSTTAMVARRIGERDGEGASVAAVQSVWLGIAIALAIGVPAALHSADLLRAMGASPSLVATGQRYTAIGLGGNLAIMLLFLNNAIFRGAGDPAIAMRVLVVSNLINLALDPCLIFGLGPFPALGVTGAAVSTLIGRSCGVLYQWWLLTNGSSRVVIRRNSLHIVPKVIGTLARVSTTGILQFGISQTSWIVLVRIISEFGSFAVAGYTIGIRIVMFVVLPAWGLSGAAATMVGQNLGAGKPERAERAVYVTGLYNMIYLGAISVLMIGMPRQITALFTTDMQVAQVSVDCLRILGYGNVLYAFGMVMIQAFNGAGDTVTPTVINFFGFWVFEVPLAWYLAHRTSFGVQGVFASIPIAQVVTSVASAVLFLRGGWKRKVI